LKRKNIIKYTISVILLLICFYFLYTKGYFSLIKNIDIRYLVLVVILNMATYFVTGWQLFYLINKSSHIRIKLIDVLLLPITGNLWAYIIPSNGTMIFSSFFLKTKYNVNLAYAFSFNVFMVYITLIITGIMGLLSLIFLKYNLLVILVSSALILSPVFLYLFNWLIQLISIKENTFFKRIQEFINSVVVHSNNLFTDKDIIRFIVFSTILLQLLILVAFYFVFRSLGVQIQLASLILFFMVSRASSLIRFLPGNIGLEEFYSAGIFKIISNDPAFGVLFALVNRFMTLIIIIPIGIVHTIFNLKYFNKDFFKNIIGK
jgi:hypothetical protein